MFEVIFQRPTVVKSLSPQGEVEEVKYELGDKEYVYNMSEQPDNKMKVCVYDGSILFDVQKDDIEVEQSDLKLEALVGRNVYAFTHSGKFLIGLLGRDGNFFSFGSDEELFSIDQIKSFGEV